MLHTYLIVMYTWKTNFCLSLVSIPFNLSFQWVLHLVVQPTNHHPPMAQRRPHSSRVNHAHMW